MVSQKVSLQMIRKSDGARSAPMTVMLPEFVRELKEKCPTDKLQESCVLIIGSFYPEVDDSGVEFERFEWSTYPIVEAVSFVENNLFLPTKEF